MMDCKTRRFVRMKRLGDRASAKLPAQSRIGLQNWRNEGALTNIAQRNFLLELIAELSISKRRSEVFMLTRLKNSFSKRKILISATFVCHTALPQKSKIILGSGQYRER